jgi:prevent-host-death family protein
MSQTVHSIFEATAQLPALVERAAHGEEIVVAKGGRPMARLVPLAGHAPRRPGGWEGKVRIAEDFDAPLPQDTLDAFEGGSR